MKASPVVSAHAQAGAVGEQEVGDRAQQVGLADARRAADEERVVGLRGHLGDGQRGGVGEPVAVADHELVEGQLGVAEAGPLARGGDGGLAAASRSAGGDERVRAPRRAAVRGRHGRPLRAEAVLGAGTSSTASASPPPAPPRPRCTRPKRPGSSGRSAAAPRARALPADSSTGRSGGEPEAVGGLVDDERELRLDA